MSMTLALYSFGDTTQASVGDRFFGIRWWIGVGTTPISLVLPFLLIRSAPQNRRRFCYIASIVLVAAQTALWTQI